MAGITGSALYLTFGGVVLDTDYRSFSDSEEIGTVDQSAGADTNRTYLTTLKDGTASATIVVQSGDTATWAAVVPGTGGTLNWAPEGTTAGDPKSYVWAIVTSREKSMEYADLVVADISWQFSGAVTDSTY
jgi:hypothetical protein